VLEVSHGRFRALYQLAPTPYVTIDASRAIVEVNQAAALILGAARQQLLGGTIDLFIDEEDRPRFRTFLAAVFVEGHTRCEDVVVRRADRTPIDAMIDGVLLREAADDPTQCVLAIVDITARKQAETARRQAQDEVLAIVSHDLRGPLNAISLGCDALASGLSPEEHAVCVAAIERAAGRCERLIKDLLGIARIESGRLALEIAPFDVRDLVMQVCRDYEAAAAASRSQLTVSIPPEPAPIHGDRDRLHQVLSNLIGNALVHARGAAVDVSVAERDASIVIAVQDQGPGIPADELTRVFDKYRQGTRHHGGAGLGLAIVKGLVEAHHGTTVVTSEPGHGARFEVSLPRSADLVP
jgi:PAS domain S-box-containing protein